jgi:hypothetical protein
MAACHRYWRTVFSIEGFLDEPGDDKQRSEVHAGKRRAAG